MTSLNSQHPNAGQKKMTKDRIFNDKSLMIVEDKQVSDYERMQQQNDLSSLYSSQKQVYSFNNIGSKNSEGYINSMLNDKQSNFNKNQDKKNEYSSSKHRVSTTLNQQDDKTAHKSETDILQIIKDSQKKNIWNQISDNILTPYAPKFSGLYDNSRFIPDELLKMTEEDNENTPFSDEKEINWDDSVYDSDDGDLQESKMVHYHHPPSLITSPLLKKKKSESNNSTLQRAQLQEPFLHSKLIKSITEMPFDNAKRKSEYSPRRLKQSLSKSLYQKVNPIEGSKTISVNASSKNFMRKVRFEQLPPSIKEQLSHQPVEQSLSPYQVISKKQQSNKIHLDKVLVIMENHDVQALQKIYVPQVKNAEQKQIQRTKRIYSATACQPSRELNKKLLVLKRETHSKNYEEGQSEQINEFQKFIRRRSCCCDECGGSNKKLEKIKDIILEKDIPLISKKVKKSPNNKFSNLTSPISSKSNKSFDQKFQRKKNFNTKFTINQGESQKTAQTSKNVSQTKLSSLNNSQTNINLNEKQQTSNKFQSFKDAVSEDCSPIKRKNKQKIETCIGFSHLQNAPSFKAIRQEREIKVKNKSEPTSNLKDRKLKEDEKKQIDQRMEKSELQTGVNNSHKSELIQINEGEEISKERMKNKQLHAFSGGEYDCDKGITQIQVCDNYKSRKVSEAVEADSKDGKKNVLSVLNRIKDRNQLKSSDRSKSVQTIRTLKRCDSTADDLNPVCNQHSNGEQLKNRSLQSFHNFLIRQQIPPPKQNRSEKSLPNILNKKDLSENNQGKLSNRNLLNQQKKNDKYDVIIRDALNKNKKQKLHKGSTTERFIAYQGHNENVLKTKQQIIVEQYQQLFESTKKMINTQKQRKPSDLYEQRRSTNIYKMKSDPDTFPPLTQINKTSEQQDFNKAQRQRSKSNQQRSNKRPDSKESIDKLKTVYDV